MHINQDKLLARAVNTSRPRARACLRQSYRQSDRLILTRQ